MHDRPDYEYAGFWRRVLASIIDSVLAMAIVMPLLLWIYGGDYLDSDNLIEGPLDFLLSWVLPAVAVIWFWVAKGGQTPGKMAVGAKIIDANTGAEISTGKAIVRYLGYFVSTFLLMLGFLWVAIDHKKRGLHDLIAGTLVVRT